MKEDIIYAEYMDLKPGMKPSVYDYQKMIYRLFLEYAETFGGRQPTLEEVMRKYPTKEKAKQKAHDLIMEPFNDRKKKSSKSKSKRKTKSCGCK